MKQRTIRFKITVWLSAVIILIAAVASAMVLYLSNSVIKDTTQKSLVATVDENIDEIEYYDSFESVKLEDDYDLYLQYRNGVIEIDDDFIRDINGISNSIYEADSTILYGESIVDADKYKFQDLKVQEATAGGVKYYIYDRKIKLQDNSEIWLRGVISSNYNHSQTFLIINRFFILFPIIIIIAIIGGFLIAGRTLKPIKKISDLARDIRKGQDLTKRIEIGQGNDEVHQLADSFNSMFDRLETSFKKERQFNSDVSHELRTPVSVILSQCEYTLEKDRSKDDYIESVELIERQGKKMSSMINSMLKYSRLEQNRDSITMEKLDFSKIANTICQDMALINQNEITLHSDIEDDIFIKGNSQLISQLIANLISNSYKYGKEKGNIFVSLKKIDDNAVLSVKDDGIGISKEDLPNIFNQFYRADSSRHLDGFGFGLSFVKQISEIHNAKIDVTSILGQGSEFIFEIKCEL